MNRRPRGASGRSRFWLAASVCLVLASVGAEAARTGDPEAVRRHAEDMVKAARVMVQHAGEGRLDMVIEYAKQVIARGREALDVVPRSSNQHARDTVEYLNAAIDQAQQVLAEGEHGDHEAALTHARDALKQARRGLSHALAL